MTRVANEQWRSKITTAEEAASIIKNGMNVGVSGFTGSGYPKAVPVALAAQIKEAHDRGEEFKVGIFTGASTAPELDGALSEVSGMSLRMPYQSDPVMRNRINDGTTVYVDAHLSHSGPQVWAGHYGKMDVAVIELTKITEDGRLIPSSSIGNNVSWIEAADKVILEVNAWQSEGLEGMHDIWYGVALPPDRTPIPINSAGQRIGQQYYDIPFEKVAAIVETDSPDRNTPFKPLDDDSKKIAGYYLEFLTNEVAKGRLPKNLLPLQSGVGNIANAVLSGLLNSDFENLTSYTEVIQDGMVDLIDAGKLVAASATAFSLSPDYANKMNDNAAEYAKTIVLRQQDISNHPEPIRRLGVLACNGLIEADIYGNVNSTHIMGSKMQNGIGGSGDFTRNAYISAFVTPSTAKGGAISAIVPMVSHHDHTEHDTHVIVTEQGLADLRGLGPQQRAKVIIENCAHPDFKPILQDYFERSVKSANSQHTPHILREALDFHIRFLETGSMKP
ncbi:MAG: acetyl-CoA hydrolase/transferase family protein [Propionibacteriaceae bacterium]|jgi:succinyl-CoA:acetate CoA-transferase|nr:acetyl-CoA hydrolase/transferase family protein [Propionibacteriaceae bacterium]